MLTSVTTLLSVDILFSNTIKQEIYNKMLSNIQSRVNHIHTFLDLEKEMISQLSDCTNIEALLLAEKGEDYLQDFDRAMKELNSIVQSGEYVYDALVLDSKGTIIASSNQGEIGVDKSQEPYFLEGKKDIFIKDVYVSTSRQIKTMAFSAPILDKKNGELLGIVVQRVYAEKLFKITSDYTGLGQTGEVYLINKDGYMITPSRFIDEVILKQKINLENIKERVGRRKDYRNIEVLYTYTIIPEMNWRLFGEQDVQEAFAPITKLNYSLLGIFGILFFIGIIISNYVARTITKPLRKLHQGMEEINKGNLDFKVATPSSDEIGQLSRTFDGMTVNLKESKQQLEEYSKDLEKKIEERTKDLTKSQKEFSSLFMSSPEAMVYVDEKGIILNINSRFTELFGYPLEEIEGRNLNDGMIHPSDKLEEGKKLAKRSLEGYLNCETIRKKKDGTLFPVSISGSSIKIDRQTKGSIVTYIDITGRKQLEKKLEKLANFDSLTGSCNKRHGLDLLDQQIKLARRRKSSIIIAYIDIDNFKSINDLYGHEEGDKTLKEVVKLLKSTLREVDIICRMGGDEFLLIFPDSSLKDLPIIYERLNKNFTELNQTLKKPYQIGLSIGFSCYDPDQPEAIEKLIRIADQKMYEEKKKKQPQINNK
jgi:diguanylate cyclase (GGDEF)-like protein/PAS domain S-box-containing protein